MPAPSSALDDLRKHLRVVTFTLMIVLASFVIVVSLPPQHVFQEALREARIARNIAAVWNTSGLFELQKNWLLEQPEIVDGLSDQVPVIEVDLTIDDSYSGNTADIYMQKRQNGILKYKFSPDASLFKEDIFDKKRVGLSLIQEPSKRYLSERYEGNVLTIETFQSFWNDLNRLDNFLLIYGVKGNARTKNFDFRGVPQSIEDREEIQFAYKQTEKKGTFGRGEFIDSRDPAIHGLYRPEFYSDSGGPVSNLTSGRMSVGVVALDEVPNRRPSAYFTFAADFEEFDPTLRARFAELHGVGDEGFSKAFPSLNKISNDLSSLNFDQIDGVIELFEELNEEEAVVFGLQIPQSVIASWGLLVLALIHVYLTAHIRQYYRLTQNDDLSFSTWIGDYRDRISQIHSILIFIVIPGFAAAYLTFRSVSLVDNNPLRSLPIIGLLIFSWSLIDLSILNAGRWRKDRPQKPIRAVNETAIAVSGELAAPKSQERNQRDGQPV